jgi:hypothetical protein
MALTVPHNIEGTFGTGTQTITFTANIAIGDTIVISIRNAPVGNTYTATDSVNTGSYNQGGSYTDATNGRQMSFLYLVANAAGTPVVTIVATGSSNYQALGYHVTGFVGTPTWDTATYGTNGSQFNTTNSQTFLSILNLPTTIVANNEILFCQSIGGSGFINSFPNWTLASAGNQEAYAICASTQTNRSGTITFGSASTSDAMIVGLADVVAPFMNAPIAWIT